MCCYYWVSGGGEGGEGEGGEREREGEGREGEMCVSPLVWEIRTGIYEVIGGNGALDAWDTMSMSTWRKKAWFWLTGSRDAGHGHDD